MCKFKFERSVEINLGCEAIFGPFISRKAIRHQELSLSQNPYPFFSTVRNQITRSYNLQGNTKPVISILQSNSPEQ